MKKFFIIMLLCLFEIGYFPVDMVLAFEDATSSALLEQHIEDEQLEDIHNATSSAQVVVDPIIEDITTNDTSVHVPLTQPSPVVSAQIKKSKKIRHFSKKDFKGDEDVVVIVDNTQSENIKVTIRNGRGEKVFVRIKEVVFGESRIFKIIPPSRFVPGKYKIEITDATGTKLTQDFTWGVLALNTNKSLYSPEETVHFSFGVLDEAGMMVCNALLELTVDDPTGKSIVLSTDNQTIVVNPECKVKDKVAKPDYEASFVAQQEGKYLLSLRAFTAKGEYRITDSFEVAIDVPFDVERNTATRIFPIKAYEVALKITANRDFNGVISEIVPEPFSVGEEKSNGAKMSVEHAVVDSKNEVLAASVIHLGKPFEKEYEVSLGFGEQIQDPALKTIYEQAGLSGHDGIDFEMPVGTPILSVDEGTVTLAKESDYGLTVVIQHAWGKSYYGHLSRFLVKTGTKVTKGERIALSGNTGLSTGSHLHFGIKLLESDPHNGFFGKVNPEPYLGIADKNFQKDYQVKFLKWNVALKKGEQITLQYWYDAPDQSPEFYTLGPLSFHENEKTVFFEKRQWQIAVDATTHMLLLWDPANGSAPTGWSVVSTYDGRFVRGESVANVLSTGGNATHTPTVSGSVTLSVPSSGRAAAGANTVSSYGHTHGSPSVTIGASNNLPAYRSMQLIQYDSGIPATVPANAIALFDASPGMPGSGWTRVTAQDANMLRINSTVATGGSDTHTHSLTWSSLTAASGQITNGSNTNGQGATTTHTHTAPSATNSDSQTSLPPYVHAVLASANSSTSIPIGMVALFDGQPSVSYSILSDSGGAFYQKFIRGNTAANAETTGGSSTHSHGLATSGNSGAASATARGTATAGTSAAGNGHTHTLSANFTANDNHTPQYVNLVVAEKIDVADLTQIHSRWRNDDGSETTATWRRAEDVAATADLNVNRRLRIEVSNEGTLTSSSITYRLEYGLKSTTCDAIATWTQVPATATSEDFQMYNSTNITDGSATTNVSGGLTDENSSFVAGQIKDTSSQTSGITLTSSEFTEIEYSIQVTTNPTVGEVFCFRLTNAGSTSNFTYALYPELTVGDPYMDLKHYRWRNDDSTEAQTTGNTLYFNPTGDGFASAFTVAAGCTNEWDCVDDGSSDTSATAPTNDGATSALTAAAGASYFTLADNQLLSGSTITRLDVYVYAIDTGNPNTNIQIGYCTTCDGANNNLGGAQAVSVGSYTQYTSAFTSLSLSTTDLNNMQLVVSADGTRANVSTVYVLVTYTKPGASWKQTEDTAYTTQTQNENIRLRVSIANTGDIGANRNFRLEYAAKIGVSCNDDESYTTVPITASSEHFEMTTSSQFTDGDATTTQLTATGLGSFTAGEMIEDPSNSTGTFALSNGNYSEFEYNFSANTSALGKYCFRVTDAGTVLDAYTIYPEITITTGGPTLAQTMRHGKWVSAGVEGSFTF